MADHSPSPSPPPSPPHVSTIPKRKATRLKDLAMRRANGHRTPVDIDVRTGVPTGRNAKTFQSYLGFLVREHVSILTPSWDDVTEVQKNMLWQDILLTFDIPNVEILRHKVMSNLATKFRQFKSILTSKFIYGKDREDITMPDYRGIDEATWEQFVQSRLSSEWQAKRKKAKDVQAQNTCPHRLSRGGYKVLEERMLEDKHRQRSEASASDPSVSYIGPPSPPTRHEKWKQARIRPSGQYTSTDSQSIAERIDTLVSESSKGAFVPQGRQDILGTAIGKPEHPGRVRGVGGHGVGIRSIFGKPRLGITSDAVSEDTIESLRRSITEEVTRNLRDQITLEVSEQVRQDIIQQFGLQLKSMGSDGPVKAAVGVSTKGSCSPDGGSVGEGDLCQLFVAEEPPRLVAIGRVARGGATIHCRPMGDDVVRVVVEEAVDIDAPLPLPTEELELVGQALQTFVAWPKHLVKAYKGKANTQKKKVSPKKPMEDIADPLECLRELATQLRSESIQLQWNAEVFGKDSPMPLYIYMSDCVEIYSDMDEINITQMQFWLMYMHSLTVELGNQNVYGFLEPQSIISLGDKLPADAKTYIMDWIGVANKRIYFAPYLNSGHWQLIVLCPSDHTVVFFCSLHKPLPDKLKRVLEGILIGHHSLVNKSRSRPKLKFIIPKSNAQSSRPQCGFYVMQWMEQIIRMGLTDSWAETFNNTESYTDEAILNTRKQWASYLLVCKDIDNDSDNS